MIYQKAPAFCCRSHRTKRISVALILFVFPRRIFIFILSRSLSCYCCVDNSDTKQIQRTSSRIFFISLARKEVIFYIPFLNFLNECKDRYLKLLNPEVNLNRILQRLVYSISVQFLSRVTLSIRPENSIYFLRNSPRKCSCYFNGSSRVIPKRSGEILQQHYLYILLMSRKTNFNRPSR